MRSLMICTLTQYCSGDQIEKNEVGWACSTYMARKGLRGQGFGMVNLSERDHLEDPGLDRRIVLRRLFRKWDVGAWTGSMCLRIGTGGGYL